jgi:hypothetical protein
MDKISDHSNSINYKKIAFTTLVKILFMMSMIFIFNTYPLIKNALNGNVANMSEWLGKSFTKSNFLLFAVFAIYFFYKDLNYNKAKLKK